MARILVIDDTRNIRKMVALTLTQAGHQVELADDGLQGLQLFGDGTTWDLTLVDQQMPGKEGREVITEARRRDPMARLVMMTAFATGELAAQVLASGALDFIRKPFSTETLRGTIDVALSHPRQIVPAAEAETEAETAVQTQPQRPEFSVARTSWRMNGFSFWPMPTPQPLPTGFEFGQSFQVRGPNGALSSCFVGVTPHIREQAQSQSKTGPDDEEFWESLCAQALLNFLWEQAQAPPEVFPVFDVPRRARDSRGGLVRWGPFGGR